MSNLVTQPSRLPTRKVTAATLAAVAAPFLADLAAQLGWTAPATFEPFLLAVLVFVAGYATREEDTPGNPGT